MRSYLQSLIARAFGVGVILTAILCFCGHFSLYASALDSSAITGANAGGADIYGYESAIAISAEEFEADPTGEKDSTSAIQKALDYALENAGDTVQLKVIIPEGTYLISSPLYIYSNTWLFMEGATLKNTAMSGCILRNANENRAGGYKGNHNIIIEGGTLDGGTYAQTAFCSLRMAHLRNVWIKNVDFVNNYNCHHAEFGGIQNLTIEGCSFHEYYGDKLKEAIQFDAMNNSTVFSGFAPFDDTCCDNVVIKNNRFYNLMRGLGSHSATVGVYYTNFLITGNSFENIYDVAIIMENYRFCTIEDNTFKSVGSGIDFKSITPFEFSGYNPPVKGYDGIYDRLSDFSNTVIRRNSFEIVITTNRNMPFAINLFGKYANNSYFPEYDYKIGGVEISDNTISTAGYAMVLNDAQSVLLSKNIITVADNASAQDLIDIRFSNDISVQGNSIDGSLKTGIVLNGTLNSIIKENTCSACGASGIYASNGAGGITVQGNIIENSGGSGIAFYSGAAGEIAGNNITASGDKGVFISNSAGKVSGNSITKSGSDGVCLSNSPDIAVGSNTIIANGGFGIYSCEGAEAVLNFNTNDGNALGRFGTDSAENGENSGTIVTRAVEKLTVDGVYSNRVQLSWQAVGDAESYSVQRRLRGSGDDFEELAEVTLTSYSDDDLPSRTAYEYRIAGVVHVDNTPSTGRAGETVWLRTKTNMNDCTSDISSSYRYSGRRVEPDLGLYCDGVKLIKDIDYKVSFKNNIAVGRASAVVTGCGQYCGFKEYFFDISLTEGSFTAAPQSSSLWGKSERCSVTTVTENSFGGSVKAPAVKHSESFLLGTISSTKQQTGIEIYARRVIPSGSLTGYGFWVG